MGYSINMNTATNHKETEMSTPVEIYKAARKSGKTTKQACVAVLDACPGVDFDDVVDMSWMVETGKVSPVFQNADGSPTAAALAWDRGFEAKRTGE